MGAQKVAGDALGWPTNAQPTDERSDALLASIPVKGRESSAVRHTRNDQGERQVLGGSDFTWLTSSEGSGLT
jgi:hypothetical protein